MDLYRWASNVALAAFDDIAVVEVAMRSAMANQLVLRYGLKWYADTTLLDNPSLDLVKRAWQQGRLETLRKKQVSADILHGKLVATLMFGFWVKLLGRGEYQGKGDEKERRIYDEVIWKAAVRAAFPNAGDVERAKVERAARIVRDLRNRVAHHEHIVWGVPLTDASQRLPLLEAHSHLLALAGFVDTDLRGWLTDNSRLGRRVQDCPLTSTRGLLL